MITLDSLRHAYKERERQGTVLTGSILDVNHRDSVDYDLYLDSGRNHVFPLIAAHGALWARGYFVFGMKLGSVLSMPSILIPRRRPLQMRLLLASPWQAVKPKGETTCFRSLLSRRANSHCWPV